MGMVKKREGERMSGRLLFTSGIILLLFISAFAEQPPEQRWVVRYNGPANGDDNTYALAVDSSGNAYVTGYSIGSGTGSDYTTIKYDPEGNQLWLARYNGPASGGDNANALILDNSGNVYVTGESPANSTGYDYATIKYDPNGNQLWVARYNGPGNDYDAAYSLVVDSFCNVYVTGRSIGSGTVYYDYATVKYDPNGNQLWAARYNGPGNNYDHAYDMAIDNSGNVYITGRSDGSGTSSDYATIKYDPNGNQLWVARYNGPGNTNDYAYALVVDDSGNVYVTGYSYGSGTGSDYATVKYDPNGNELWVARYNGPVNGNDKANSLTLDNSGNIYVTGDSYGGVATGNDYATIKYDPNGNQLWATRYNGSASKSDSAGSIAVDDLGNVYVTGESANATPNYDYATVKYDPNGNQLWAARYNGLANNYDAACDLSVDSFGNVYVTGDSYGGSGTGEDYATIKYTQHNYCTEAVEMDLNGDCKIDFKDFAILAEDWLGGNDWLDLAMLTDKWLDCNFALQEDCL